MGSITSLKSLTCFRTLLRNLLNNSLSDNLKRVLPCAVLVEVRLSTSLAGAAPRVCPGKPLQAPDQRVVLCVVLETESEC